ncbi:MAG: CDGSH iron-sulfur domain-containing protein [Novosphingobium sp.]|nr:CDGSH iron-sulfur domain-containing protein [Novosphingobium sp.]MCP5404157.1 CDGSH iron-sulfur domain-containing protein [Novosphingobium sp.]
MPAPEMPQKSPYSVEVEAGKNYWWCSCGKSENQPFCDASHRGSEFAPLQYTAEKDGTVYFCGCKKSANGALCDASHRNL